MASRKTRARAQAVKRRERSMDEDMLDGDNATAINEGGPLGGMDEVEGTGEMAGDLKSPGDRDDNDLPDADTGGSSDEAMAETAGKGVEEAVPGEMTDERGMVCTECECGVEEMKPETRRGRAKTTRSIKRNRPSDKRGQKASAHRKRAAKR